MEHFLLLQLLAKRNKRMNCPFFELGQQVQMMVVQKREHSLKRKSKFGPDAFQRHVQLFCLALSMFHHGTRFITHNISHHGLEFVQRPRSCARAVRAHENDG